MGWPGCRRCVPAGICEPTGWQGRPCPRSVCGHGCVCWGGSASGETHSVPFLSPASDTERQGLVRVVNRDDRAGTVSIEAIDDTGRWFGR